MSEQEENEEETEAEVVQREEPTFGEHIIDLR